MVYSLCKVEAQSGGTTKTGATNIKRLELVYFAGVCVLNCPVFYWSDIYDSLCIGFHLNSNAKLKNNCYVEWWTCLIYNKKGFQKKKKNMVLHSMTDDQKLYSYSHTFDQCFCSNLLTSIFSLIYAFNFYLIVGIKPKILPLLAPCFSEWAKGTQLVVTFKCTYCFHPKQLALHSSYTFYQLMRSLGIKDPWLWHSLSFSSN